MFAWGGDSKVNQTRQPEQGEMLAAGRFQLAGGADAMKVALEPGFSKAGSGRRAGTLAGSQDDEAQGGQIQLLDKLAQEAGRMIRRHPVFRGGREDKMLSVIGGDGLSHGGLDAQSNKLFKKIWFEF